MNFTTYFSKKAAETRNFAVPLDRNLSTDEDLSGTPTVVDTAGVLTISNVALNTAERTFSGRAVAVSRAVEFTVAGGVAGTVYTLRITAGTNATYPQTLIEDVRLEVR